MTDFLTMLVELEAKLKSDDRPGWGLLPIPCSFDNDISRVINCYIQGTTEEQAFIRDTFTDKDSFAFLCFCERMACLAVREKAGSYLFEGLIAHAIEGGKFDERENMLRLSLVYHSAVKIGADPALLFKRAAAFAVAPLAEIIRQFPDRKPEDRSIQAMGYEEGKDAEGFRYRRTW